MADVAYLGPNGRRPLLRKLVGDVLRRHRREQQRTLADVAQDARVSVQYLSEIERGRKEASSEVLGAVCGALRIELADLLAAVRHDLVKDQAPAPAPVPTAVERGQVDNVVSLAVVRQRRAAPPPVPGRFGEPMLLAA
jgi:transcriptional regulator with XRE-family HTH domain